MFFGMSRARPVPQIGDLIAFPVWTSQEPRWRVVSSWRLGNLAHFVVVRPGQDDRPVFVTLLLDEDR